MIDREWEADDQDHLDRAMQAGVTDIAAIARGAGIAHVATASTTIEFGEAFLAALECEDLSVIVAKVAAVGPEHYGMDLQLPENAFRFRRWIQTRKGGRSVRPAGA